MTSAVDGMKETTAKQLLKQLSQGCAAAWPDQGWKLGGE